MTHCDARHPHRLLGRFSRVVDFSKLKKHHIDACLLQTMMCSICSQAKGPHSPLKLKPQHPHTIRTVCVDFQRNRLKNEAAISSFFLRRHADLPMRHLLVGTCMADTTRSTSMYRHTSPKQIDAVAIRVLIRSQTNSTQGMQITLRICCVSLNAQCRFYHSESTSHMRVCFKHKCDVTGSDVSVADLTLQISPQYAQTMRGTLRPPKVSTYIV